MMEIDEIIKIVDISLNTLYENEEYLFENGVSERNLVFILQDTFICFLKNIIKTKKYSVDCEYNRNVFNERKYKEIIYEGKNHKIFPDFILHERGSNSNNILAIEFKNFNNNKIAEIKKDCMKLKAVTNNSGMYKYKLGLFIKFGINRDKVIVRKFINGKEQKR